MARLTKLAPEQWDPELRAMTRPETATDLEMGLTRFFAHTPQIAKGLFGFGGALKVAGIHVVESVPFVHVVILEIPA